MGVRNPVGRALPAAPSNALVAAWLLGAAALVSPALAAPSEVTVDPDEEPEPGTPEAIERAARRHEQLFARVSIGASFQSLIAPDAGIELRARGSTFVMSGAVGVSAEKDLILHLTSTLWTMIGPTFTADGEAPGAGDPKGSATALTFGPGLTYYAMPWNVWGAVELGLGWMFMDKPAGLDDQHPGGHDFRSKNGWVLTLSGGKEWWVHRDWAAGASAFFMLSSFPEPNEESLPRWGGPAFGIRLTGTYD